MAKPAAPLGGVRRVRITSNGWAAVLGASVMFAMAVQTQSVWMQVVGSALLGLLGISWWSVTRRRAGMTVTMQAPTDGIVGVLFDIRVLVRNSGRGPTAPLRIRYELAAEPVLMTPVIVYVDPVASGDRTVVSVSRVPLRRGSVRATRLAVDAIGPFGFFTSTRQADGTLGLWAAPPAATPIDLPRVLGAELDGSGPIGPGLDVRGVREWRPGDAVRHVHWRSTARTGRLAVLDYGEPTVGTIGILIAGTAAEPRFEAALAITASTAWRALEDGVVVLVAIEDAAGSRLDTLTPGSWHRTFAGVGTAVPGSFSVDTLLASVGFGGVVLLTVGSGVPFGFRSHVAASAAVAGARVIEVADWVDGQRLAGQL